jgi:hypothetical protein
VIVAYDDDLLLFLLMEINKLPMIDILKEVEDLQS